MKKPTPKSTLKRRDFVKKSVYGLGGLTLAPTMLPSCNKMKGANDMIMMGHIGVGSRGTSELKNYFLPLQGSRTVAVCDVFESRRKDRVDLVTSHYRENGVSAPECKAYLDYEELLARDDIDAVHIMTPDHWHLLASIKAARAGKHIMLAKPLGLSYPNAMLLKKELDKNNVQFIYGTQQRTFEHMQLGIDMIREGKIGKIEKVDVWAPGGDVDSPNCQEAPIPEELDFERWTGPAPLNSYCPARVSTHGSWFQYDYSIGFLAGWGAHPLDVLVWGIRDQLEGTYTTNGGGAFWPQGSIFNTVKTWDLNLSYESGMAVNFMSWDKAETAMIGHRKYKDYNGTTFYGSKGWISLSRNSAESDIPKFHAKLNEFPRNSKGWMIGEPNTMGQAFLDVIQGRKNETCTLDEAILSDTISHMGNIAIRTGQEVTWDPEKGKIVNHPEANLLYNREMRDPYTL